MANIPAGPSTPAGPAGPPANPETGSHVDPAAVDPKMPEAVRFMLLSWAIMIAGELLHQILTIAAIAIDPSELVVAAKQAAKAKGEEVSESVVSASMWGSIAVAALIQLAIIALFVAALVALQKQKKWAPTARRLLQVFSIFFAIRVLAVFVTRPASSAVPLAFYAVDGVVQIIIGVAGALGLFYASQKEATDWAEAGAPPAKGRGGSASPRNKGA